MKEEIFKPAGNYKIEPVKEVSPQVINEMIIQRWNRLYGDLTKKEQIKFKWPKKTVNGILVRCPRCGKIHESKTILTKKCAQCHNSFAIIPRSTHSRVVWIPHGKRRIYDEIYNLTYHKKLVVR